MWPILVCLHKQEFIVYWLYLVPKQVFGEKVQQILMQGHEQHLVNEYVHDQLSHKWTEIALY